MIDVKTLRELPAVVPGTTQYAGDSAATKTKRRREEHVELAIPDADPGHQRVREAGAAARSAGGAPVSSAVRPVPRRRPDTPDARTPGMRRAPLRGPHHFFRAPLEDRLVQAQIGHQPLQLSVLVPQLP